MMNLNTVGITTVNLLIIFSLKLSIEVVIYTDSEIDEYMDDDSDGDEEYYDEEEDSVPYVSFVGNLIIIVFLNEKIQFC